MNDVVEPPVIVTVAQHFCFHSLQIELHDSMLEESILSPPAKAKEK
jgi:hypothetical protein